jgi:cytochrome c biogenesis protein
MASPEQTVRIAPLPHPKSAWLVRVLDFLSSVRLGVILLIILVIFSMIGMLIVQENVNGFEAYYASLTPAEKTVYGALGFFDIYYSWYFKVLLLWLSLSIILASIDRFPSAWKYITEPLRTPTRGFLLSQKFQDTTTIRSADRSSVVAAVSGEFKRHGFTPSVSESTHTEYGVDAAGRKDFSVVRDRKSTVIFAERGRTNRLGAYIVHVALLTLFLGHFVALVTGFDADVRMTPGQKTDEIQLIEFELDRKERFNVKLPFSMECTDIEQRLIDPNGSIDITNTLDWRTQMKISDPEYGNFLADVSLNSPLNYRGYRFFQAQTIPVGSARNMTLELTPEKGGEPIRLSLPRNGSATLPDGTVAKYESFQPDFTLRQGQPDTQSGEYNNPAAVLQVTPPGGETTRVYAFQGKRADNIPIGAPKLGYKWRLVEFEKSPFAHVLSIKYDPFHGAFIAWYFGGFGLIAALAFVFFVSHRRVWARIEQKDDNNYEVVIAGNTNRNPFGFERQFADIAAGIKAARI